MTQALPIVYKPRGRAGEYADLAANLYDGCVHGCTYCFGPDMPAWKGTREEFHARQTPKRFALERLEADVHRLKHTDNVLMCFTSDLYPPDRAIRCISREALEIFAAVNGPEFTVLTKGAYWAPEDFDLYRDGDVFATSISFSDGATCSAWEPHTASLEDRWTALDIAAQRHIETWVSIEPVIYEEQALDVIRRAAEELVGHVRIGPRNHGPTGAQIGLRDFGRQLAEVLEATGIPYLIKQDLRDHMPAGFDFDTRGKREAGGSCRNT